MSLSSSIKTEAKRNSKLTVDYDSFKDFYIEIDTTNNITVTYPGFDSRTFDKNLFLLLSKAKKEPFKHSWYMKPYMPSYEKLGTVIYWPLIMYLNNCPVMEEFKDYDFIYIPNNDSILELARSRDIDKRYLPLEPTTKTSVKASRYYKNFALGSHEINRILANNALTTTPSTSLIPYIQEKEVTKTINSTDIENKYIDLSEIPNNPTTNVYIYYNDFSIAIKYNFDYVIIEDDNQEMKRITWDTAEIMKVRAIGQPLLLENSGIRKFIKAGDSLNIKYSVTAYKTS